MLDAATDCSEATVIGEIDGETFVFGYKHIRSCSYVYLNTVGLLEFDCAFNTIQIISCH